MKIATPIMWIISCLLLIIYIFRYVESGFHFHGDSSEIFMYVVGEGKILTYDPSRFVAHFLSESFLILFKNLGFKRLLLLVYPLTFWFWLIQSLLVSLYLVGKNNYRIFGLYSLIFSGLILSSPTLYEICYSMIILLPFVLFILSDIKRDRLKDRLAIILLILSVYTHQSVVIFYGMLICYYIKLKIDKGHLEKREFQFLLVSVVCLIASLYNTYSLSSLLFLGTHLSNLTSLQHLYYSVTMLLFFLSLFSKHYIISSVIACALIWWSHLGLYDYQNAYSQFLSRVYIIPAFSLLSLTLLILNKKKLSILIDRAWQTTPAFSILTMCLMLGLFSRWEAYVNALEEDLNNQSLPVLVDLQTNIAPLKINQYSEYKNNWALPAQTFIFQSYYKGKSVEKLFLHSTNPPKHDLPFTLISLSNIQIVAKKEPAILNKTLHREVEYLIKKLSEGQ